MSLFSGMKVSARPVVPEKENTEDETTADVKSISHSSLSVDDKKDTPSKNDKRKVTDYADCTEAEEKSGPASVTSVDSELYTPEIDRHPETQQKDVGDKSNKELDSIESGFIESLNPLGQQVEVLHVHSKYSSDLVGLDLEFQPTTACGDDKNESTETVSTSKSSSLQQSDSTVSLQSQDDEDTKNDMFQSEADEHKYDTSLMPTCMDKSNSPQKSKSDTTTTLRSLNQNSQELNNPIKANTSGFSFIEQEPSGESHDDSLNDELECDLEVIEHGKSVDEVDSIDEGNTNKPCYQLQLTNKEEEELFMQTAEANLLSIREEIAELEAQQSNGIRNQQKQNLLKIEKYQKQKNLQREQAQALLDEDFEKAEYIDKQMQQIEQELATSPRIPLPSLEDRKHYVETAMSLYEKEIAQRRNIQDKLTSKKLEGETMLGDDRKQFCEVFEKEKQDIEKETFKLEKSVSHLALDREHLVKRENNLEAKISEKIARFVEKKQELSQEMINVKTEIASLESKLIAMKEKEREITKCIEVEDSKIDEVKGEFQEERDKLEEERNHIEEEQIQIDHEVEKVNSTEKKLSEKKQDFKVHETRCLQTFKEMEEKLLQQTKAMEELVQIKGKLEKITEDDDWPCLQRNENDNLMSLREKVKANKSNVKEKMAAVVKLQSSVTSLKMKVNDIEEQIQNLNEAKKLAVSGRNFVEAKHLANQVKEWLAEGQSCQKLLESKMEELADNTTVLEKLQDDSKQEEEELLKQEMAQDLEVKENALKVASSIQSKLENGDLIKAHQCFLEAQLNASYFVVKEICLKHGHEEPVVVKDYFDNLVKIHSCDGDNENTTQRINVEDTVSMETSKEILRLENLLQEAVEKEDYDTAEQLNTEIENLKSTEVT